MHWEEFRIYSEKNGYFVNTVNTNIKLNIQLFWNVSLCHWASSSQCFKEYQRCGNSYKIYSNKWGPENLLQHSRNRIFLSNINELIKQTVLHLPLAYLHTQQWCCIMPTPCKQLNKHQFHSFPSPLALWPNASYGPLFLRILDHTEWCITVSRLLWMSDQHIAETSTWQHTTLTTDKHPCPWQDSNQQSQQMIGCTP